MKDKVYVVLVLFQGIVDIIEVIEDEKEAEKRLLDKSTEDGHSFKTYDEIENYMISDAGRCDKCEYMLFETKMTKKQGNKNGTKRTDVLFKINRK